MIATRVLNENRPSVARAKSIGFEGAAEARFGGPGHQFTCFGKLEGGVYGGRDCRVPVILLARSLTDFGDSSLAIHNAENRVPGSFAAF